MTLLLELCDFRPVGGENWRQVLLILLVRELAHVECLLKVSTFLVHKIKSNVNYAYSIVYLSAFSPVYPMLVPSISLGNAFFTSSGVSVKNSRDYIQRYPRYCELTISKALSTEAFGISWFLRYMNPHV